MKNNFKKITAIAAGALMVGMTMGNAVALSPSDNAFDAVVYGAQAHSSDQTSAESIASWLGLNGGTTSSTTVGGEGETEDEVILGGNVAIGQLLGALTDSDVPSLLDTKVSWDDGNGNDDLDVHESITLGTTGLKVQTSADDNDYTEPSIEIEDGDFAYAYIFDDFINASGLSSSNTITLEILGSPMEFQDITSTTVTVSLASEKAMKTGETYTDSATGKTVTVTGVYSGSVGVSVDGVSEIISNSGTEKVNGININVDDIGYNSNMPETSVAILKIGEDITKTYTDGEAYIGEDEDAPVWVWDISWTGSDTAAKPSIGITLYQDYNAPNEDVIAVGESYIMPGAFAEIKFDSLTNAVYEDVTIDFDTSIDLKWNNVTSRRDNAKAIVITGNDGETFQWNSSVESDKVYITYVDYAGSAATVNVSTYEIYYYDNEDKRPEYVGLGYGNTTSVDIGDFINDETTMAMGFAATAANESNSTLTFVEDTTITAGSNIRILIDGSADFEYLGATDDTADVNDVLGGLTASTQIGTKDNDVMDYYGTIIRTPDTNADSDTVILSIPGEPVYAQVSVLTGASTETSTTGSMVFTDADKSSWSNKNVILVGGSCINTATAEALGVSAGTCDVAFTGTTNVGTGQYIIKVVGDAFTTGKTALVVAGYEKENTEAAVSYLKSNVNRDPMIEVADGNTYFGTTGVSGTSTVTKTA